MMVNDSIQGEDINSNTFEQEQNFQENQLETTQPEHNICSDWSTKCCCTSRMKFKEAELIQGTKGDRIIEDSSNQDIIDEIATAIRGYRRESVLNTISEFEKKLLTLGMNEDTNFDYSDSDGSEYDEINFRRRSELAPKPLVLHAVELRRATVPQNIQKEISE